MSYEMSSDEVEARKLVEESRKDKKTLYNSENTIKALKYVCEHRPGSIKYIDFVKGLIDLGCNYMPEDQEKFFPGTTNNPVAEGLKSGELSAGLNILINETLSSFAWCYINDRFVEKDNDTSLYHYIREVSGDKEYTKEYVDSLLAGQKRGM